MSNNDDPVSNLIGAAIGLFGAIVSEAGGAGTEREVELARRERLAREEAEAERMRIARSRWKHEDPKDFSPVHLSRPGLEGDAFETEGGQWQLVVRIAGAHAPIVVVPRAKGAPSGDATGDARFDRRFEVPSGAIHTLVAPVREAWLAARDGWLYAGGTLTATRARFAIRQDICVALDAGLDIGAALRTHRVTTADALLAALADHAWRVGVSALESILAMHGDALVEAYRRILPDREPKRARLRAHALTLCEDWAGLAALGATSQDPMVRSDAYDGLVDAVRRGLHAARAPAMRVVAEVWSRGTGLDAARVRTAMRALETKDATLLALAPPAVRERFCLNFVEHGDLALSDAACAWLAQNGTAVAYRELAGRPSEMERSRGLAKWIRARIDEAASGGLALVAAADAAGGLAVAGDEETSRSAAET